MNTLASPRRAAATLLALLPLCVGLASGEAPPRQERAGLATLMEGMKGQLKRVATRLRAEDGREDCLAAVAELQRLALAAKLEAPPAPEGTGADELAERREAFRREMNALCVSLLALEIELLDGDVEAAWERIQGPLFQQREAAHARFQLARD